MTSRREFFKYAGIAGGAVAATAAPLRWAWPHRWRSALRAGNFAISSQQARIRIHADTQ